MEKNFENNYGYKKCPECGSSVYTTEEERGDGLSGTSYDNVWCTKPDSECDWFIEIDVEDENP